jgi:calcineurin-like phosphoesterase family protein
MLYGHSHGRLPGTRTSLDVGVDCWSYLPVTLDEIRDRLATLPAAPAETADRSE